MKTITSFKILMELAHKLGQAKLSENKDLIKKAEKAHNEYKQICLESDEISLNVNLNDL